MKYQICPMKPLLVLKVLRIKRRTSLILYKIKYIFLINKMLKEEFFSKQNIKDLNNKILANNNLESISRGEKKR